MEGDLQTSKYWIRPNKRENYNSQDKKLWKNTKGVNEMGIGDKIIFYISGKKYMKFAGIAQIKSKDSKDGCLVYDYDIKLPEKAWVKRPSKEFLMQLDVVKDQNYNFNKNNWLGLLFQMTRQISKSDFLKIRTYLMDESGVFPKN